MIYVAIDGDDVGNILESHILSNDTEGLSLSSKKISTSVDNITSAFRKFGGGILYSAGDGVLACFEKMPEPHLFSELEVFGGVCSFSAGAGPTLRDAWIALKKAKLDKPSCYHFDGTSFTKIEPQGRSKSI